MGSAGAGGRGGAGAEAGGGVGAGTGVLCESGRNWEGVHRPTVSTSVATKRVPLPRA